MQVCIRGWCVQGGGGVERSTTLRITPIIVIFFFFFSLSRSPSPQGYVLKASKIVGREPPAPFRMIKVPVPPVLLVDPLAHFPNHGSRL